MVEVDHQGLPRRMSVPFSLPATAGLRANYEMRALRCWLCGHGTAAVASVNCNLRGSHNAEVYMISVVWILKLTKFPSSVRERGKRYGS